MLPRQVSGQRGTAQRAIERRAPSLGVSASSRRSGVCRTVNPASYALRMGVNRVDPVHLFRGRFVPVKTEHQQGLGHSDVSTTMIYTHVLKVAAGGTASPLEALPSLDANDRFGDYSSKPASRRDLPPDSFR